MDGLIPDFAKLGMVGLVIALLVGFIIRLILRIGDLEKQNTHLTNKLLESADKRIAESREQGEIIRGNMTALTTLTEVIRNQRNGNGHRKRQ